jgi:dipeptidyl aminopeptidase/acylaminoacyl peptidase
MRIDANLQINARHCSFTSEGNAVAAVLYEPPERHRKCPAIVLSPPRSRTIDQLAWLARSLAARGYMVLAQRYRDGDTRYQLRDVDDIRNGITFLEGLPKIDLERLGVIGHSRGGAQACAPRLWMNAFEPPSRSARPLILPVTSRLFGTILRAAIDS